MLGQQGRDDMSMNQKDAVFQAVCNVTGFDGSEGGTVVISKEQRAQVNMILFDGIRAGKIACDKVYTDSDLKTYVSGLQSNWLRKDKRLNGGIKYEAKNPGSRAGMSNPQIKATKALLSTLTPGTDDYNEVETVLNALIEAERATKQVKTVDFSALPAELAAKFAK